MDQTTQTMMTAIEDNTGHPIEFWIGIIRKNGIPQYDDILDTLINKYQLNPIMAEYIAKKAKGAESVSK